MKVNWNTKHNCGLLSISQAIFDQCHHNRSMFCAKVVNFTFKFFDKMFGTREDFESFSDTLNLSGISNEPVRTDWELHDLSKKRLPKSTLPVVAKQLGLTTSLILNAIDLNKAQYDAMSNNDLLSIRHSEHLLKMMELVSRGRDLWGTKQEGFKGWMKDGIRALGGKRPMDFIDTFVGIDMAIAIIGRIEHGVYS